VEEQADDMRDMEREINYLAGKPKPDPERRERIATAALMGMLANKYPGSTTWLASQAIECADALITALGEEKRDCQA
jgi:hypothetical protein